MRPLRIIGYAGLVLLSIVSALTIYLAVRKGDWHGAAFGIGAFILIAFLGNYLWISGLKQKDPHYPAIPNRVVLGFLLAQLGLFSGGISVERLLSGYWLAAFASLVAALFLLERAYRVLKGGRR